MKTVLIVDDEKKIRSLYGKMFCREGFNVLKAKSAEDAHDLLAKNNVDLILLDIKMSKIDGATLFKEIETLNKKTNVIVSSVYPIEDQKMLIKGATDYFDKSECIRTLIQKAKTALCDFSKNSQAVFDAGTH